MSKRVFDFVEDFWDEADTKFLHEAVDFTSAGAIGTFTQAVVKYLGSSARGIFVHSGREAIRRALLMAKSETRRGVLMPTFCCKVVAAAVIEAGCRPILLDSGDEMGSIDWDSCKSALKRRDVAAVIVPHLFGAPLDFRNVMGVASQHGVVLIEDCAQCLGGHIDGQVAGTLGDVSVFSFGFDKPLSLCGGGLLLLNNESLRPPAVMESMLDAGARLAPAPEAEMEDLLRTHQAVLSRRTATADARRPSRERLQSNLEGLWRNHPYIGGVLMRIMAPPVPGPAACTQVGAVRAALGLRLLEKYDSVKETRNQHHDVLAREIRVGELQKPFPGMAPAWLRGKLFASDVPVARLDRAAELLRQHGYRAGRSNWSRTLDREPRLALKAERLGSMKRAHRLCANSIDLPIHQNLSVAQLCHMAECLNEALA